MRIPKEHRQAYHDAKLDYVATGQTDNDYLDLVLHNSMDGHVGKINNKLMNRMSDLSKERFNLRRGNTCNHRWNLTMLLRFERTVNGLLRAEGSHGRFACVDNIDKYTTWSFRIDLKNGPL